MPTLACTLLQQSLTKNFIIQNMERKKLGQIEGRISIRRLVRNLTIQFIIINLHTCTKYDNSSLYSFTKIFDEKFKHSKYGKKENRTNTGKNKEKAGSQSHDTMHHYQPAYQIWFLYLARSHRNLWLKTSLFKVGKKENRTKIQGRKRMRRLVRNPTIK